VVLNLAVNARDAMPTGGELTIATRAVDLAQSHRPEARPGRYAVLSVSDTGCGLTPEVLAKAFEPFFTTKGVGKGTGLGLATVYGIVKQHNGWVEVVSQVGVGTTFNVFLPAAASSQPVQAGTGNEPNEVRGGRETILVVEDEPILRELVTQILRDFGYDVMEAPHGKEAVNVWQRAVRKPDLLVTDMMMPEGMTGWELAENLRGREPSLKVIYTSGYSTELFGNNLDLGDRSSFLPKPYNPRTLAKVVRDCLDN
jgi:CheY-like chemotaxis protein